MRERKRTRIAKKKKNDLGKKQKILPRAFVTSYTCIRSHPCIILDLNCPGRIAKTRDLSAKTIDSPTRNIWPFFSFRFVFFFRSLASNKSEKIVARRGAEATRRRLRHRFKKFIQIIRIFSPPAHSKSFGGPM